MSSMTLRASGLCESVMTNEPRNQAARYSKMYFSSSVTTPQNYGPIYGSRAPQRDCEAKRKRCAESSALSQRRGPSLDGHAAD